MEKKSCTPKKFVDRLRFINNYFITEKAISSVSSEKVMVKQVTERQKEMILELPGAKWSFII